MPEPSNSLSPRTRPSRARGEADDAGETVDAAPGDGPGELGSTLDANPGADPDAEAEPAPGASLDFVDGGPPAGYDSQETLGATPESTIEGLEVMASPPQRVGPGATLGGYRIDRRLGAGGMGEVFLAQRLDDQRRFALKVLSQTHAARLYRFKREFRALADVRHDNLVALEELVVMPDGRAFFTMEVVEGVAFVDYVRQGVGNGQLPNLVRLNRALRQLIAGVRHLHRAGFVHRDLKPSNVLITREGRVVILDFGLISELAQPSHPSSDEGMTRDGQIMGTPAYMAPEQAGEANHGPPVDYYAVGVMLFECLTGTLPFRGQILDILIDKRHGSVPSLRERLHESAPSSKTFETLEDLCRRALSPAPGERPKAEAWLAALGVARSPSPASAGAPRATGGAQAPFVGREVELAVLHDGLATVRSRLEPVAVHIRGDSGLGKSALVLRFLDQARAEAPGLAVLRGRCLERESVPYKGIDAVVDALAVYLRKLDPIHAAALQPRNLGALRQLFPVLGDAWPEPGRALDLDPAERRRRGLAALREVLARIGERYPLVVTIDDFQWADVDSARLVGELMRPPEPPAMLLVVTFRSEVETREPLRLLTSPEATADRDVRSLELAPLSAEDARALAQALLARQGRAEAGPTDATSDEAPAEAVARRAQGNPFYIGQMVLGDDPHESSDASLDRLVARRIVALDPGPRALLAAVAVASGPTPLPVVLAAGLAALPPELRTENGQTFDEAAALGNLERENLLIRHEDGRVESAHDRIRAVAVGELPPHELAATHLALAEAYERHGAGEAQAIAEHYALGGDERRALDYTERAADEAAQALAFERATELYRRALAILGRADEPDTGRRRQLELALAKQLVDMGRGGEAADRFEALARTAADPRAARDLRRRAASERVKIGLLDEGMDTITPVLREIGVWQPRGVGMAILSTVWHRLCLIVRGHAFERRAEADIDPDLLERIDSLLATKTGLSHHEAIFAGYQQSRAMRLALRAGEPKRLIRCLVHDASIFVAIGRREKGRELMTAARELLPHIEEPEYHRVVEYVTANHLDHSGRWPEAAEAFAALQVRLETSPNSGWIRGASTVQWNWVRKILGRYGELRAELPELLAVARDLGQHHVSVSLGSLHALTLAVYGEGEDALLRLDALARQWHPRQVTFQHIILAMTRVELSLLIGDAPAALDAVAAVLDDWRAKVVANMMPSHVEFHELRARAQLAALADGSQPSSDRGRALARVRKDLAKLAKSHKPQAAPLRAILLGSLSAVEGDESAAEQTWREAAERLEAHDMQAHLAAVRVRLAALGDAGAAAAAQAYFEAQGLDDPQPLIATLVPAPRRSS